MALTRKGKAALANALRHQAGNLVEFRSEMLGEYEDLFDASNDDIAAQLNTWLDALPGDGWEF